MALDPIVVALLSRPNFAHIATLMPDGSPNVTPVWIGVGEDKIVFSSGGKAVLRYAICDAILAWHCRWSILTIPTRKFRFAGV
jgi:hypothetical protein